MSKLASFGSKKCMVPTLGLTLLSLLSGCGAALSKPTMVESNTATSVEAAKENDEQDAQQAIASTVPNTDIFLFAIDPKSPLIVSSFLGNVTNRSGYDNQPNFLPNSNDFLFSSIIDGNQSDIYVYQSSRGDLVQRTKTKLSEYSPTPLADGSFSSVTVESDGTQRLWKYTALGNAVGIIGEQFKGIGYHTWINDKQLAVFIVDDPIRLDVINLSGNTATSIATQVGRSLHKIPGTNSLSFTQEREGKLPALMSWNSANGQVTRLITMPSEAQDMVWLPDGRALTVREGTLLMWDGQSNSWLAVFDIGAFLPGEITRLAVNDSATRLAVVSAVK